MLPVSVTSSFFSFEICIIIIIIILFFSSAYFPWRGARDHLENITEINAGGWCFESGYY